MNNEFFEAVGGRRILETVSKTFYDKVFRHKRMRKFFLHVRQDHQESQQVDFMQQALGGAPKFCGRAPLRAHMHINITEELYGLRQELLLEALNENDASPELISRWLAIEDSFKRKLVKKDLSECEKRFGNDTIIDFPS